MILSFLFFFNDTATTEIYTLSLHDALPIYPAQHLLAAPLPPLADAGVEPVAVLPEQAQAGHLAQRVGDDAVHRSEEHTSELQSRQYLVCRLLLEKKKTKT